MAERICIYLSQRGAADSPASNDAEVVLHTLVEPALIGFPDFDVVVHDYVHEPGSIADKLLEDIVAADLVIADLTDLSPSGYYQLGVRAAQQLPLILILQEDYVVAVAPGEFNFVRYPFDSSPSTAGDKETINALSEAIQDALNQRPKHTAGASVLTTANAEERRNELADKIEGTASVIASLRVNSLAGAVHDLRNIADELRAVDDQRTPSAIREAIKGTLEILASIREQLKTTEGAQMAIAGSIALVVGTAGGWPAVTALGLGLAYFRGERTFLAALEAFKLWKK